MPQRKTAKKRAVKKSKNQLFLPFPLVVFLLLCSGVFLAAWTFRVSADDVLVTAAIKGPPISQPGTITSPADGTHFSAVPIVVSGNCPTGAAYVEIFRNNFMSGSAICSGGGTYTLQIDLFPGQNQLTVHSFNVTDDEGPVSAPVTVYYDVPQPPVQTQTPSGTTKPAAPTNPLNLKTAFVYKGYYINQQVIWPLEISGGSPPYAFNIDWGDGNNSVISRKNAGQFDITHTYKNPGGYKGSYTVKVQASDSEGNYSYMEFFVIVNAKDASPSIGSIYSKPPPTLGNLRKWLWLAWPAYASVFLMIISYKLGEREEFKLLAKKGLLRR